LEEEKRPGLFFPVEEDSCGTYIFNAKDLCLLPRLPDLIAAGADSLKLEGRMKSVYYVGAIVRLYRAALDYWQEHGLPEAGAAAPLPPFFFEELQKIGSRGYTANFLDGPPDQADMLYEGATVRADYAPVGIVRQGGGQPLIETRNPVVPGETVEYLGPGLTNLAGSIVGIADQEGNTMHRANPNQLVRLTLDPPAHDWQPQGLVRKRTASGE
jgi:putative protease